ncbi:hypothetical protein NCZ17_01260 [Acinetobacter modestus]|uniref:hypothetical protein n=1 Tax=Acinetobacter modestus TaxID=1776740 RepID=UPI00202F11C8|nr:hypothetical protein [Acinetobacter modestus]MCM1958001.1 hypothetical protein [Acinetobacter modestus]
MNGFFIVWNEDAGNPTFKHETQESAEREAERLAKQNQGQKFHVLSSICTLEMPNPVIKTNHDYDLPF